SLVGWGRARPGPVQRPLSSWPRLDLESLPEDYRGRVLAVLDKPTLQASAPAEAFHCQPAVYRWLLDHPDRAVRRWRKLGAQVAGVVDRGNGRFGWSDEMGSDVHWDTVVAGPRQRVWYAEGVV